MLGQKLKNFKYSDNTIWWIIGLAVILRLAIIPLLGSNPENQDIFEYGEIAWNIVQGHGFSYNFWGKYPLQPTAYAPALYCYTLVPWFAIFGIQLTGPRIVHALFLAAACWFIYKIGDALFNRRIGLIAAGIWAVYPELIFLTVKICPENLMFLPMTWALWKSQNYSTLNKHKNVVNTGMLTGLACWFNPSLQVLGLAIPLSWRINGFLSGREGIKRFFIFVFGVVLIITPWTLRNYIRLDAFLPMRSAFAYNMWRGNHPGASGTVRNEKGENIDVVMAKDYAAYIEAHLDSTNEVARDRFYAAEVRRFIRENPTGYLSLTFKRFKYYWFYDPTHPLTRNPFYILPWILTLVFAIPGLWISLRKWRQASIWYLQILGFTALFSLTIVVPRYRMPIYPAMFLLAAVGLDSFYIRFFARRIREDCG
ncbi:MAG: glycosyltransferase family 39 protein [bacterium]|nr:glycosyltransferase family 39 protein [bacterium]